MNSAKKLLVLTKSIVTLKKIVLDKINTNISAFTLIELMIAITIVAILATMGMFYYAESQKIARDARRKQDLKQIAVALNLYYQNNGRYPCVDTSLPTPSQHSSSGGFWIQDFGCGSGTIIPFDNKYASSLPTDPLKNDFNLTLADTNGYRYNNLPESVTSANCPSREKYFSIMTRLENKKDPERCETKQYTRCDLRNWCDTSDPYYPALKDLYIITSQ